MGKFQGIFKRYEKKYLLNERQYRELMTFLSDKMTVDQYGKTKICNIYFDTPSHLLVRRSIEKPKYKEKLRLRTYGVPQNDSTAFIELKKKFDGVVYKRRISANLSEAMGYLCKTAPLKDRTQISNEIDWFLSFYGGIRPAMYLSYDRIALYGNEDNNLRLTVDTNITYRQTDLDLAKGSYGAKLLRDGWYLVEIKIPGSMPLWLSEELTRLRIFPTSFSKYGTAYTVLLKQELRRKYLEKQLAAGQNTFPGQTAGYRNPCESEAPLKRVAYR